jgi:hypothetical protein
MTISHPLLKFSPPNDPLQPRAVGVPGPTRISQETVRSGSVQTSSGHTSLGILI